MSDEQTYERTLKLGYRPCSSCEREHPAGTLQDGWCPQCRGEQPEPPSALMQEIRRIEKAELYKATAAALRKAGFPDRAAWLLGSRAGSQNRRHRSGSNTKSLQDPTIILTLIRPVND